MDYKYKISVIIPVYNTEKYLVESIESVLNQTLDFQKNVQIILVNDGSTDESEKICKKYCMLYSKNIKYISMDKNSGVSAARNIGKSRAEGKYTTFLDSDDLWSENAFEEAIAFFDAHFDEIDFVSSNLKFFESSNIEHILNIPLKESKIIDMHLEHDCIRTNCVACIFKSEVVRKIDFDERQHYWEDAKFISRVLLGKKKFGMIMGVMYFYRKRFAKNSATQTFAFDISHYVWDLKILFDDLYKDAMRNCNEFPPMFQMLMAYILAYRFSENLLIPEKYVVDYDGILHKIISQIDDVFICKTLNAKKQTKIAMISFKYSCDVKGQLVYKNGAFLFNKSKVFDLNDNIISIWNVSVDRNYIQIEGKVSLDISIPYEIFVIDDEENEYPCYILEWLGETKLKVMNRYTWSLKGYLVRIDNINISKVKFMLKMDGQDRVIPFCVINKESGKIISYGKEYIL